MKRQSGYRWRLLWLTVAIDGFLGTASVGRAADLVWTKKADMPTARWLHSSAVVNGKIYVIGGSPSEPGDIVLSSVEEYDPVANTWTRKTDMPIARTNMVGSSAVVGGKIYVIGGDDDVSWGSPTVQEYDPATDTWTRKTDMPTSRWSLATCAVDGKICAIGGAQSGYTGLSVVEQYDPATDTWTRKANMPVGVWGLCACVVDARIYALGGRPDKRARPYVQEYDPVTDTWTQKADMLVDTSQMGVAVLGDKILVIGGWPISGQYPYTTVQVYDPETDIWTQEADAPFRRAAFSTDVVNNRAYVIGGTDRPHPCPATSTVYEFGPMPPDFNGDGTVDATDMALLVDNWRRHEPLYDIGPFPWGDSVVDEKDVMVLMEWVMTPGPDASNVPCDVILNWISPEFAGGQDVYFGTSFEAVHSADRANPLDVLVSMGQPATTYDPEGLLEYGQTYYWRVDTILGSSATIYRGPVLSFTTAAFAYPIQNVTAKASSLAVGMGPEKTVDGSGLDDSDGHSAEGDDMWLSGEVPPHWIEFEFDKVYALHETWVWNSNQRIEPFLGFGAKTIRIEYSVDGATWTPLDGVPEFARAPGEAGYTANTTVSFGGVSAKYVKLTIDANWGGIIPSVGLSEVRFLYIPSVSVAGP